MVTWSFCNIKSSLIRFNAYYICTYYIKYLYILFDHLMWCFFSCCSVSASNFGGVHFGCQSYSTVTFQSVLQNCCSQEVFSFFLSFICRNCGEGMFQEISSFSGFMVLYLQHTTYTKNFTTLHHMYVICIHS